MQQIPKYEHTAILNVSLPKRAYNVLVGKKFVLDKLKNFLDSNNFSKIIVITDDIVYNLHYTTLAQVLPQHQVLQVNNGEKAKSFAVAYDLCEKILANNIDRKSLIIAFGGGVVGDLAGFIASILLRGIAFVQIPTTLLAMVDSSVGGKVAINSKFGKNLIGNFYQPKLVLCDLDFLTTLPERDFLAGYAEVVIYAFINDHQFFDYLDENLSLILTKNSFVLQNIIAISCEIKANIVVTDEFEQGDRALLNFGHSFAHIFETETNYSNIILHGEAVALGMAMAMEMSVLLNMLSLQEATKAYNHLLQAGFKLHGKFFDFSWLATNLEQHIFKDKKNYHQQLTFILLQNIGLAKIIKGVDFKIFQQVLHRFI